MKNELIKFLEELEPKYTLQQQSQSILEARYKFKPLFECMENQPNNPLKHWVKIDGKKFLYTQTVQEVLEYLQSHR